MAMIGFKNTHNLDVYVNPAQVLYVMPFEEGVTIIALAMVGPGGKPLSLYVRGHVDHICQRLDAAAVPAPRPQAG